MRPSAALAACASLAWASPARAGDWEASVAAGGEGWFAPDAGGHGFGIFDLRGHGVIGGGDLHLNYNTDTLMVGVERLRVGTDRLEFSAALRAEGVYAGLLADYYVSANRVPGRGFFASYALGLASLKWLPAENHSIEFVAGVRAWLFARADGTTSPDLTLPSDTWVFEPRLRYTFWRITSPGSEWGAQVLFPRITGIAAGVELGADLRTESQPWGALGGQPDVRNHPGKVILMTRQWMRAGVQLGDHVRLQFEEFASWGDGEDDLTRVRVGGMTPYVVPIPGLPWPALLCERLVSAQASVHLRPSSRLPHELGVALSGGVFNDIHRVGALDTFDGAGGVAAFTDLRFGRWQVYVRAGYGFPVAAFERPNLSMLAAFGVRLF